MVDIREIRRSRQENSRLSSRRDRKSLARFLLHSAGLLASVLGPALLVCVAGGSIFVFAAIVFHDALGATVGVMLYQKAARGSAVSIVPSARDEASNVQLRPAA